MCWTWDLTGMTNVSDFYRFIWDDDIDRKYQQQICWLGHSLKCFLHLLCASGTSWVCWNPSAESHSIHSLSTIKCKVMLDLESNARLKFSFLHNLVSAPQLLSQISELVKRLANCRLMTNKRHIKQTTYRPNNLNQGNQNILLDL